MENRTNVVLSRDPSYTCKDAVAVHSLEELFAVLKPYDSRDVYVIGGASVYGQLLPYCNTVHVTKIDHAYEADAHFPDLDRDGGWEITADSDEQSYFDLTYHFLRYERKSLH